MSIFPCLFFVIKLCSSDRGYKRAYHIRPGTETLKIFPSVQFAEPTFQDKLSSSKKTFLKSTDLHESFIILSKICYGNEKKKTFQQNLLFLPLFFPGLFISPFFFISSLFARAISLGFTTDLVSKYSTIEASSSVSLQNN